MTLKATAQSLRDADKYTVAALAGDLASDLLLNYYSTAQKVTVDGHTLYNAAVEDITTLFQNGKFHVSNPRAIIYWMTCWATPAKRCE